MSNSYDSDRQVVAAINAEWVFGRCALLDALVNNVNRLIGRIDPATDGEDDFAVKYSADLRAARVWLEFEGLIVKRTDDTRTGKWRLVDLSTGKESGPYRMGAVACLAVRHLRPDILDRSP